MRRDGNDDDTLVELGEWPRLDAQILRHRLETVDIPVMVQWSGDGLRSTGTLLVAARHAEFARAVLIEVEALLASTTTGGQVAAGTVPEEP